MVQLDFINTCGFNASVNLPAKVRQRASFSAPALFLAVLIPACLTLTAPFLAFGVYAINAPEVAQKAVTAQPIAALQAILGLLTWTALWAIPIHRNIQKISCSRDIEFAENSVRVREKHLFGQHTWSCKYSEFKGLSLQARTSLSQTRHELNLLHPDPRKSLMLLCAREISAQDVKRVAEMTKQRQLRTETINQAPESTSWPHDAGTVPLAA